MECFHITTIDGPSASGKSTVARRVAQDMGYIYVDSGALYRVITWKALEMRVDINDAGALSQFVENIKADFFVKCEAVCCRIDGVVPGNEIRSQHVNEAVSQMAVLPVVREKVVGWLRSMTKFGNLVVEGRDIGTVVFPAAENKFYLDADLKVRAKRRHAELHDMVLDRDDGSEQCSNLKLVDVEGSLDRRDTIDATRQNAPLKVAQGAVIVDTTEMTIEDAARFIVSHVMGK